MRDKTRERYKVQIDDIESVIGLMKQNSKSTLYHLDFDIQAKIATQLVINDTNNPIPLTAAEWNPTPLKLSNGD